MSTLRIYIHTDILSVENGAHGPLQQYFDLAKLFEVTPDTGQHYGDDSLELKADIWPLAEGLLREAHLLYRVKGIHTDWQNVRTDAVRSRLGWLSQVHA